MQDHSIQPRIRPRSDRTIYELKHRCDRALAWQRIRNPCCESVDLTPSVAHDEESSVILYEEEGFSGAGPVPGEVCSARRSLGYVYSYMYSYVYSSI